LNIYSRGFCLSLNIKRTVILLFCFPYNVKNDTILIGNILGDGNIKTYFKWAAIAIAITIAYGGMFILVFKLFSYDESVVEVTALILEIKDKPTQAQLEIINTNFNAEDIAVPSEVANETALYNTIHQMANTKIIAEDGIIGDLKAITKVRVENVQNALKNLGIKDEKIIQMIDRWSKQDFSKCVEDHNYIWSTYLNGTVGKAVKLR
jgi:hypothetical protein